MRFFEQVMARTKNAPGLPPAAAAKLATLRGERDVAMAHRRVLSTTN